MRSAYRSKMVMILVTIVERARKKYTNVFAMSPEALAAAPKMTEQKRMPIGAE